MVDSEFLSRRLDRGAAPLVVGDLIALMALLTVGVIQHRGVDGLAADPAYMLVVWPPFLIGWLLVAPLVGAYSPGAVEAAKSSIPLVVRSWIPAAAVGFLLRVYAFGDTAALPFVVVMFVLGTVVLAGWRAVYFKVRG
ncbi:DUF3054 domain-containing protein [Haloparvum alkalitolerans]|uniref:DUF3054 domain-containing protein n=1 Tax=Haloparvum alkalitolerans TaxID=1042953 RepID=UPI003CF6F2EE